MAREVVESAIAAAIDAESLVGIPWGPGAEMTPIVLRRWSSFARRHPKFKRPTAQDRVHDLAKGLQEHYEPKIHYTPLSEWLHLAGLLEKILNNECGSDPDAAHVGS